MTIYDIFGQKWTKFQSKFEISFKLNCGYRYSTKCVKDLIWNSKKVKLWHFMTFYDILWHFMTFYDILWHFFDKKGLFSPNFNPNLNFFWILLRLYILHKVCKRFDLKWRKWWLKSQIMTFYDILWHFWRLLF